MPRYPILPDRSALLLFDMVNDFLLPDAPHPIPDAEELIARLARLVAVCRQQGMSLVYVKPRGYAEDNSDLGRIADIYPERLHIKMLIRGTKGVEVHSALAPHKGELVVEKRGYSAFHSTELEARLRERGIDTLVIGGVATSIGCDTVAREAFIREFKVVFLSDGTLTGDLPDRGGGAVSRQEIQRVVLATMAFAFARIASVEEVVQELNGRGSGLC